MLLVSSTSLLGMQKTLPNSRPVGMKAFLSLSFWVTTIEVAPLSVMAEGMDPLRTPSMELLMLLTCSLWSSSYSSTQHVGGALLSSIE
jgi:hypothetical protein